MRSFHILIATICGAVASATFGATYAYEAVLQNNLALVAGQEVDVQIYLTETRAVGERSIIGDGFGLNGSDFKIVLDPTAPPTPTRVITEDDVILGPEFEAPLPGQINVSPAAVAVVQQALVESDTAALGTNSPTVRSILLATLTFTTGDAGTTVFRILNDEETANGTATLGSIESSVAPVVLDGFFESDPAEAPSITFTVIVPEPASTTFLFCGAAMLFGRRRRSA
jgi:hypothetical protein